MKQLLKNTPFVGTLLTKIHRSYISYRKPFETSEKYWLERYKNGDNSGDGSYGKLAEFKAEFINKFVNENKIKTVIELGSGDGNQLTLANYPIYTGYDISPEAISLCLELFKDDTTKSFKLMNQLNNNKAELTLSLDVIYHLIEDHVFAEYMHQLFNASERFVVIYASNTNTNDPEFARHFKNRKFTDWCEKNLSSQWELLSHTPNIYPYDEKSSSGSVSDFFVYQKY